MNELLKNPRKHGYLTVRSMAGLLLLFVIVECASLFIHPFGSVSASSTEAPLMNTANIEQPVLDVMQRSCQNCHSDRTSWPWYSHVAPVSWLIQKDVHNGREHWNMSKWDQYSLDQRQDILSRIAPMVRNRQMPLPKYLALHPEAKLTDSDVDLIYRWSRSERKRIKSESSQLPSP
jgi:Haem-binding domain